MSSSISYSFTSYAITKLAIKKKGLYTSLPTPKKPWESISIDYMLGIPSNNHRNDFVFVLIDRFSKISILIVCKKSIIVEVTAKLFIVGFILVWQDILV